MRRIALLRPIGILVSLLILGACAQKSVPEDNFYRLTLKGAEASSRGLPQGVIQVERFAADGLTGGRAIVFSDTARNNLAQTYHYHFWMEPPTILLQMGLADALRAAGAAQVVTPEMRVEPDFTVTGRIRAFEQVRGTPGFARAQIELAVTERANGRLVLFKSYSAEPRTQNESVGQAVTQMSAAIDQIYSQFLKDLAAR
jgi:ABC-type uncharacterized transport system auxiliary subunit